MTGRRVLVTVCALLALAVCAPASPAGAQSPVFHVWTSVGSAGTVDEGDAGLVSLNGATAAVKNGKLGTVNIRYNVVAVGGLFNGEGLYLLARFRDAGAGGRVVARLKRHSLTTGATTVLATIDSDKVAAKPGFQLKEVITCSGAPSFVANAYFVDVEISRTADVATANAALAALQVGATLC